MGGNNKGSIDIFYTRRMHLESAQKLYWIPWKFLTHRDYLLSDAGGGGWKVFFLGVFLGATLQEHTTCNVTTELCAAQHAGWTVWVQEYRIHATIYAAPQLSSRKINAISLRYIIRFSVEPYILSK